MALNVAILGTGKIGCDILCKVERSPNLICTHFVGRGANSDGIAFGRARGVNCTTDGLAALERDIDAFDLVFDATSADAHDISAPVLEAHGKTIINLTPASRGVLCVPDINGHEVVDEKNISMITCGGQASLPILKAIASVAPASEYIEVVSSISSRSAGPATRLNLDNYITTTERAITHFIGSARSKAILNINPAEPSVNMQTAVSVITDSADLEQMRQAVNESVIRLQRYLPGYNVTVEPLRDGKRIFAMIKVDGNGDYLPSFAGNLDIITSSAVRVAELIDEHRTRRAAEGA